MKSSVTRFIIFISILFQVRIAWGQTSLTSSWRHASLMGWEQTIRTQMFDRTGSYYGRISDRGYMEYYTPRINDEYHLNLFTYTPLLTDDYIFFRSPNGLRVYGGDLDEVNLYSKVEIRGEVEIIKKHNLTYYGNLENSVNRKRLYLLLGYQYLMTDYFYLGLQHTVGSVKSDMDLNGYVQLGNEQNGLLRFDVSVLDYLSNMTYDNLTFGGNYSDTSIVYSAQPFVIQFKAQTPLWRFFRAELIAGWQNKGVAEVSSLKTTNQGFKHEHGGLYAGGLLEYSSEKFTLGSVYKLVLTETTRDSVGTSIYYPNYTVIQVRQERGFYLLAHSDNLFWESWAWFNTYLDRQTGENYSVIATIDQNFRYLEDQILLRNRFYLRPDYKGYIAGIEHIADIKKFSAGIPENDASVPLPPGFSPMDIWYPGAYYGENSRLVFSLGYQFHPRARFLVMTGYDLDNDYHVSIKDARLDNISVNLDIRW